MLAAYFILRYQWFSPSSSSSSMTASGIIIWRQMFALIKRYLHLITLHYFRGLYVWHPFTHNFCNLCPLLFLWSVSTHFCGNLSLNYVNLCLPIISVTCALYPSFLRPALSTHNFCDLCIPIISVTCSLYPSFCCLYLPIISVTCPLYPLFLWPAPSTHYLWQPAPSAYHLWSSPTDHHFCDLHHWPIISVSCSLYPSFMWPVLSAHNLCDIHRQTLSFLHSLPHNFLRLPSLSSFLWSVLLV